MEAQTGDQRRVLQILLAINAAMFLGEIVAGLLADSTGLIADSLDMFADALVYGVGLYAVGRSAGTKIGAARWSGYFQMALAIGVLADITRRTFFGSDPESALMLIVGGIALVANVTCLKLLSKHRDGEVHMRASWIFSKNDVIANVGVMLAGILVHLLASRWPDIVIGLVITVLVFRGGIEIVRDAASESRCNGELRETQA
jgi:Co/Zn/Cd efflux system component